ncbi:MAG: rhomboid family intramembrane serine protease [Pirellulales bacterium]
MGIYDRDYYRGEGTDQGGTSLVPQSLIVRLLFLNAGLYLADFFFGGRSHAVTDFLALHRDDAAQPWMWWRLLSYAFVHDPRDIGHIACNMLGLWIFGRELEVLYGAREFLRIYLGAALLGGIVWLVHAQFSPAQGMVIGASGAVMAAVVLFALHFPQRTILVMMIFPLPAWALAALYVGINLWMALGGAADSGVAVDVHLAGAAFAFAYYRWGAGLQRWLPDLRRWLPRRRSGRSRPWFFPSDRSSSRPRPGDDGEELRIYRPDPTSDGEGETALDAQADAILAKLHQQGDASLTPAEREILEAYSRRLRQRRR